MLYGYVLWLPKNYTLDLQDGNIIALLANYVPFTILPLFPSPSLGEVGGSKQEPLFAKKTGINSLYFEGSGKKNTWGIGKRR